MIPPSDSIALLALLVCGHALADFVFQTRSMVHGKRRSSRMLLLHAAEVAVVQGVVLLPFFAGVASALAVLGIAVAHAGIDRLRTAAEARWNRPVTWLTLDQLAHLLVLLGAWSLCPARRTAFHALEPGLLTAAAAVTAAYAFNVHGGAAIVAALLRRYHLEESPTRPAAGFPGEERERRDDPSMGQTIGILERVLILTFGLAGEWSVVGLVLAAKSIARFKELDDRRFGEYYLIGTLASVLVAVTSALAVRTVTGG